MLLAIFASYFPLQEHAAIFASQAFLVYRVGTHTRPHRARRLRLLSVNDSKKIQKTTNARKTAKLRLGSALTCLGALCGALLESPTLQTQQKWPFRRTATFFCTDCVDRRRVSVTRTACCHSCGRGSVDVIARIYDSYDSGYAAVAVAGERAAFAQASGVTCLTCQLVIEGSLVSTSRR